MRILSIIIERLSKPAAKLTAVKAMLLQLLYNYRALGEFTSEFAAEKLSYFLQRFGEKQLKHDYQKGYYGPYSGKVRHILYDINGYYLKGYEQKDAKPFEPLQLMLDKAPEVQDYIKNKLTSEQRQRLEKVAALIIGFESPYGLELLATVDFIISENSNFDTEAIIEKLWSERKKTIFQKRHIEMAIEHLTQYQNDLYPTQ
jgi:hypothetical protein